MTNIGEWSTAHYDCFRYPLESQWNPPSRAWVVPKASVNALEKSKKLADTGIGHPACHLDISMITLSTPNTTDIITKNPTPDVSLIIISKFLFTKNYI